MKVDATPAPSSAETVAGMVERLREAATTISKSHAQAIKYGSSEYCVIAGSDHAEELDRAATMLETLAASLAQAEGELQAAKRPKLIDQNGKEVGWERRDEPGREDVWRDKNDTIWQRPTAWAYFAVCRARDAKAAQAAELQERVRVLAEALRPFVENASHTRIFLASRQKIHPIGLELWDAEVAAAAALLSEEQA